MRVGCEKLRGEFWLSVKRGCAVWLEKSKKKTVVVFSEKKNDENESESGLFMYSGHHFEATHVCLSLGPWLWLAQTWLNISKTGFAPAERPARVICGDSFTTAIETDNTWRIVG